ncbi:Dbl homology domain-containing protein [Paraphysoderma sedebokerense]|nr:Dbl homology domain-containing protein [Paraphysoderma sedebokerense]
MSTQTPNVVTTSKPSSQNCSRPASVSSYSPTTYGSRPSSQYSTASGNSNYTDYDELSTTSSTLSLAKSRMSADKKILESQISFDFPICPESLWNKRRKNHRVTKRITNKLPMDICDNGNSDPVSAATFSPAEEESKSSTTVPEPKCSTDINNEKEKDKASNLTDKRNRIINEILTTERTYVTSLRTLLTIFADPLLDSAKTNNPILPKNVIQSMFSNIWDIMNVNEEFLRQLEERLASSDPECIQVGDIFTRMAPFLRSYSFYSKNFNTALQVISAQMNKSPTFDQFLRDASARPDCKGLSFQAYLIMPVQRIPRYRLLLEDLLKKTPPLHPDHLNINTALKIIADVALFVNEQIRQHEMFIEMLDIQNKIVGFNEPLITPTRRLLKRGNINKVCRKRNQPRLFFLFNDMLVYVSPMLLSQEKYLFHRKVDLQNCDVADAEDAATIRNMFQIISRDKSFAVFTDTEVEKREWMESIRKAISAIRHNSPNLEDSFRTLNRTNMSTGISQSSSQKVIKQFLAPVWVPDSASDTCVVCCLKFSVLKRKHHCRYCGNIVCGSCSTKSFSVLTENTSMRVKPFRCCDTCFEILPAIESAPDIATIPNDAQQTLLAKDSVDDSVLRLRHSETWNILHNVSICAEGMDEEEWRWQIE